MFYFYRGACRDRHHDLNITSPTFPSLLIACRDRHHDLNIISRYPMCACRDRLNVAHNSNRLMTNSTLCLSRQAA